MLWNLLYFFASGDVWDGKCRGGEGREEEEEEEELMRTFAF